MGRKHQARPARMAASGGRTGAGQALPCVSNPANPASTLHTLERAWTRWGQLFQGVTGFGTPPPIQCAPVTCASRPGARTPRSQGAAFRPAFRASALPPRSGRPGCPCRGRSWDEYAAGGRGRGKLTLIPSQTPASLRLDRRAHSPPLLSTGCAAPAVPVPLMLRQGAPRVDPPVKPEGCG